MGGEASVGGDVARAVGAHDDEDVKMEDTERGISDEGKSAKIETES